MRAGWAARDAGNLWECAKRFEQAAHIAAKERKGHGALARAGYWTARCARESGSKQGVRWEQWLRENFPGTFHASLLAEEAHEVRRRRPVWGEWVESVIEVESGGNPHAVSRKGAVGVMQIMPRTARTLVRKGTPEEVIARCLRHSACNRKLGERYLHRMLATFNGEWLAALYAYNGGPTRAKAWMKANRGRDPVEAIDRIGIEETRDYVGKVMASLWRGAQRNARRCGTLDTIREGRWPRYHRP